MHTYIKSKSQSLLHPKPSLACKWTSGLHLGHPFVFPQSGNEWKDEHNQQENSSTNAREILNTHLIITIFTLWLWHTVHKQWNTCTWEASWWVGCPQVHCPNAVDTMETEEHLPSHTLARFWNMEQLPLSCWCHSEALLVVRPGSPNSLWARYNMHHTASAFGTNTRKMTSVTLLQ